MAGRKLARDFLIARQPLFRQILASQRVGPGATRVRLSRTDGFGLLVRREFSVFNDLSNKLKGEFNRNPELQQSVKDLKKDLKRKGEGFKEVREGLEARTKQSSERLFKIVDDVRTEAESTAKKVYSNVEEKISAAKSEVKDSFGFGKQESSEFPGASDHFHPSEKGGTKSTFAEGKQQDQYQQRGPSDNAETLFGKVKSGVSFLSKGASTAFQKVKEAKPIDIVKKGYNIVKDELKGTANKRKHLEHTASTTHSSTKVEKSTRTDIVVLPRSKFWKKWDDLMDKVHGSSMYKKATGISEPAQEIAENVRDWYETTDSRVVHKIQNISDTVFGETDIAASQKEIKQRDPTFSLPDFVAEVQECIKPVLIAYFKGDAENLRRYCTPEVIERCMAEHKAFESQDMFFDNKILHISEVDVREVKMMGDSPIIIIGFQTQQVHCIRDRHGIVREGGKDTIHTVYYAWALQQVPVEELGEEASHPIWKLREMQQFGVQALI